MTERYLTKSRFLLAMQCPTKLYYTGKDEYADQSSQDPFLAALAEGGFQAGALARSYFPGGHMIGQLDDRTALVETTRLFERENVVLYEPAFRYENLFVRVDILVKEGKRLRLYEVKSKSWNPSEKKTFIWKKGHFTAAWKPYLYDIAFQAYVVGKAVPGFATEAFLMFADKTAKCPTDGLNQKFRIRKRSGNKAEVLTDELTSFDLSVQLLTSVPVGAYVSMVINGDGTDDFEPKGFEETLRYLADCYAVDQKISPEPGGKCGKCEFISPEENRQRKSGFKECWKEAFGWRDEDFREQLVLDLWDYRKKDSAISNGKLKIVDLEKKDLGLKEDCGDGEHGLSRTNRQFLQIEKERLHDETPYIDRDNLKREMSGWRFPLHFIDFETATAPIPFTKGRYPYEMIAFQFSHHIAEENGSVRHAGQFLLTEPGVFPNYEFLRALKTELGKDRGSVFRYSHYENTVLNVIHRQLREEENPPGDSEELLAFIESISHSSSGNECSWQGSRDMVDLLDMVKRYYYHPLTRGSNSIKYVLPAILESSFFLQRKYAEKVYGAEGEISSLNFKEKRWIEKENGKVKDPYLLLPKMFTDIVPEEMEHLMSGEEENAIRHGGAAMTAYARLQYEEMKDYERNAIIRALLQYCELDTLAMVMLYEAWREEVS